MNSEIEGVETRPTDDGFSDVSFLSDDRSRAAVRDMLLSYYCPNARTSESIYQSDSAQTEGLELLVRIASRLSITRTEKDGER